MRTSSPLIEHLTQRGVSRHVLLEITSCACNQAIKEGVIVQFTQIPSAIHQISILIIISLIALGREYGRGMIKDHSTAATRMSLVLLSLKGTQELVS